MKKVYWAPEVDLVHLSTEQRVLQGSETETATGADVTILDESGFDDLFF